jgi:hypothetical protein
MPSELELLLLVMPCVATNYDVRNLGFIEDGLYNFRFRALEEIVANIFVD